MRRRVANKVSGRILADTIRRLAAGEDVRAIARAPIYRSCTTLGSARVIVRDLMREHRAAAKDRITVSVATPDPATKERFFDALVASGMREARCEGRACPCVGRRFFTRDEPRTPELCPPCRGAVPTSEARPS